LGVRLAVGDTPDQLYALWDGAVGRSRSRLGAALADGGLGQLVHACGPDGRHASLRRLLGPWSPCVADKESEQVMPALLADHIAKAHARTRGFLAVP
jgi:hypothetical protein